MDRCCGICHLLMVLLEVGYEAVDRAINLDHCPGKFASLLITAGRDTVGSQRHWVTLWLTVDCVLSACYVWLEADILIRVATAGSLPGEYDRVCASLSHVQHWYHLECWRIARSLWKLMSEHWAMSHVGCVMEGAEPGGWASMRGCHIVVHRWPILINTEMQEGEGGVDAAR